MRTQRPSFCAARAPVRELAAAMMAAAARGRARVVACADGSGARARKSIQAGDAPETASLRAADARCPKVRSVLSRRPGIAGAIAPVERFGRLAGGLVRSRRRRTDDRASDGRRAVRAGGVNGSAGRNDRRHRTRRMARATARCRHRDRGRNGVDAVPAGPRRPPDRAVGVPVRRLAASVSMLCVQTVTPGEQRCVALGQQPAFSCRARRWKNETSPAAATRPDCPGVVFTLGGIAVATRTRIPDRCLAWIACIAALMPACGSSNDVRSNDSGGDTVDASQASGRALACRLRAGYRCEPPGRATDA